MEGRSLAETSTWAFSFVFAALIAVSILIEHASQIATRYLWRRRKKALIQALQKIKEELMLLGFISLLLTVAEKPITKICVAKSVSETFLPCSFSHESSNEEMNHEAQEVSTCEKKGLVSLISEKGIKQLHIFIFVLAVFHVFFCLVTMTLGLAKMRRWKAWENETHTLEYQISYDPRRFRLTRQTSFGQRHLKFWSNHPLLLWPVAFFRQFYEGVSKADYFTLRHGFIMAHFTSGPGCGFDFHMYLARALDEDFEAVVGISVWLWIFSLSFIFFKAVVFYHYFWLPFIPLAMVLVVGTKLQVIITKMCVQSHQKSEVVGGALLVKPDDKLFWFGHPQFLLHLIHFILFQNSFQLAYLAWKTIEFGVNSCMHEKEISIVLKIVLGVAVQFISGYVTLPLYALVTQMGSRIREAVFTERVASGLRNWHERARKNVKKSKVSPSSSLSPSLSPRYLLTATNSLASDHRSMPSLSSTRDFTNIDFPNLEIAEVESFQVAATECTAKENESSYNGEISFGLQQQQQQLSGTSSSPDFVKIDAAKLEITEAEAPQVVSNESTYNGEISFGLQQQQQQQLSGASSSPDFVKIDVAKLEITEAEAPQVVANESTYNGEISFGLQQPQQEDA